MISHLSYCISHNNKIGYSNFVSTILQNCQIKLPVSPSFELEPENYLTKDTLSRLKLRVKVVSWSMKLRRPRAREKLGSKGSMWKRSMWGVQRSVRKSQRLAETKSPKGRGDAVMINLNEDHVSPGSTAGDSPLLSTTNLAPWRVTIYSRVSLPTALQDLGS